MKETETMSETANDSENKISELTHQLEEKNTALENMKSEVVQLGNKLKQGEEEVGYSKKELRFEKFKPMCWISSCLAPTYGLCKICWPAPPPLLVQYAHITLYVNLLSLCIQYDANLNHFVWLTAPYWSVQPMSAFAASCKWNYGQYCADMQAIHMISKSIHPAQYKGTAVCMLFFLVLSLSYISLL